MEASKASAAREAIALREIACRTSHLRILSSASDTKLRRIGIRIGLATGAIVLTLVLLEVVLQIAATFVDREASAPDGATRTDVTETVRILCLGESTTHGFGETPYPTVLQRLLKERVRTRSFDVTNAGLPGTHSAFLARQLPALLAEHEPDIVIAMMGANDEVYFTEVESIEELSAWQVLLLHSRVYKLFRLILTNTERRLLEEPEAGPAPSSGHLRSYRRRYEAVRERVLSDPGAVLSEVDGLIAMAQEAGQPGADGTLEIPAPYWHVYEILHRAVAEWLVENGRGAEAEARLRTALELHPANARLRRRLVWVLDETDRREARDRELEALEELLGGGRLRLTAASWKKVTDTLKAAGVALVALQYPLRDIGSLRAMIEDPEGVYFVENVENFERALAEHDWDAVFIDRFAGDFGHSTELGNTLIAERLVEEVFLPRFGPGSGVQAE